MKIRGAALAVLLMVGSASAFAQNNTGYPSGTKCGDLQEPRRSACTDAFDPRPNAAEIINKPAQKPLLPAKPRALGQKVPLLDPNAPIGVLPPLWKKQTP